MESSALKMYKEGKGCRDEEKFRKTKVDRKIDR